MADWLKIFLSVTPWMMWFFLGIGLPWAFVLLPRRDWQDKTMLLGTGLALGPTIGTTWLFFLGTFAKFTFSSAFIGTVVLAFLGCLWAWRRRHAPVTEPILDQGIRISALTITLVIMMTIGMAAMIWDTAFWPFLRYDTLWTFGYNAKIFTLHHNIPDTINYYPQLVPLTFTFGTLAWGEYSDHAARAAVPWFILSSVFAAYLLGWRLYQKRIVGLITAALWLMLPSTLVWASSGDLEHPIAIYFSLATLFYILAWREITIQQTALARRYAILSGLMAGTTMWTKPTGGAYALGVILVIVMAFLYLGLWQHRFVDFWRYFKMTVVVGLATTPIGGMWYLRNIILDHAWTNFPPAYWQDLAQRSGFQLGWVWLVGLLSAFTLLIRLWQHEHYRFTGMLGAGLGIGFISRGTLTIFWNFRHGFLPFEIIAPTPTEIGFILIGSIIFGISGLRFWRDKWFYESVLIYAGVIMMTVAIIPTARSLPSGEWTWQTTWNWLNGFREANRPLSRREVVLFIGGGIALLWCGRQAWREQPAATRHGTILAWLIGLPFFTVWFWSFSYHYRLVLTVLPIFFATIAALMGTGFVNFMHHNGLRRTALVIIAISLCLPAPLAASWHTWHNALYGNTPPLDNDDAKYAYANPGLMQLVQFLRGYATVQNLDHLRILAPGENRLAFFFPTWHIEDDQTAIPADLEDLRGYDLYILFNHDFLWRQYQRDFTQVSLWTDLAWAYPLPAWDKEYAFDGPHDAPIRRLFKPIVQVIDDQTNRYEVFVIDLDAAYEPIIPENPLENVVFGEKIQLLGYDLSTRTFKRGEIVELKLYWRGTKNAPPYLDYVVYIHLLDPTTGQLITQADGGLTAGVHFLTGQITTYPMRFLTPNFVFQDRRTWILPADIPTGRAELRIGIYDPSPPWPRLPMTISGEPAGDGITLETAIIVE